MKESRAMPSMDSIVVNENDVICARGKRSFHHSGNKRLRRLLQSRSSEYDTAQSKLQKGRIVSQIIDQIQKANGRFLRKVDDRDNDAEWAEISPAMAREKVGQGFRDLLGYRSSTKVKLQRKRLRQDIQRDIVLNSTHDFQTSDAAFLPQAKTSSNTPVDDEEAKLERAFLLTNIELLNQIKEQHRTKLPDEDGCNALPSSPLMTALVLQADTASQECC
mmetsp:Transcript_11265/g.25118  ORF Transcript_11265/g.25118 Transcript_11265/m.25118 type:complete len:219 (-) Transcript_11265:4-660(-)|eukprot:CAMPEP_0168730288 /NCGR_PEP_ID=MMETSP0724-20121128/6655_1 /TAXON_ID=265536 /ORGANISM="Amphiprora sp., Strain CCMP467" /LENGTH=218 /DNA_ID=CAMNT_0008777225 /DNA_START=366 /DNA_END=1022 /DNA_ORIENTATION=-